MSDIELFAPDRFSEEEIKYIALAVRCDGKWMLVHGSGSKWSIPFVQCRGAAPREAAHKLIFSLTGNSRFYLDKVASFRTDEVGMIFYADILSPPESPEIELFNTVPPKIDNPEIVLPIIRRVNGWLCDQSSKGEIWDVYDKNRRLTGRRHRRGDTLAEGDYHLVVHVWMRNSKGEFLITKRTANKGFPNMWESTGGSALTGDDSLAAALREVKEETGLTLDPARGRVVHSYMGNDYFVDVWLFDQDFDIEDVVLQENETCDRMYASEKTICRLEDAGKFVPYSYLDILFGVSR